tara:strand:+ start:4835 stop:5011 length:177 start_codon:yes stop_codon:yes gene_type:complete
VTASVAGCCIGTEELDSGVFVDELFDGASGVGWGAVAVRKIGMIRNHATTNSMKAQRM